LSETPSHRRIKELLETKLRQWFGASISEYPSSGHELDVYAITHEGVRIYVEIIWTHSKTHFLQDMNALQQSDADVKLVVGSPEVINDVEMQREFTKVAISQTKLGKCIHDEILDGNAILSDPVYVEPKLHTIITNLVDSARKKEIPQLKIIDVKAVRTSWIQGDFYNIKCKLVCAGKNVVRRIKANVEFLDPPSVKLVSVENDGKVSTLDWSSMDYSWSPDGTDENNTVGELKELRQGDCVFVIFPDAVGWGIGIYPGGTHWWKNFFQLKTDSVYKVKITVKGISGNATVLEETTVSLQT